MDLPGRQPSFKFLLLRKKIEQGVLVVKEIRDLQIHTNKEKVCKSSANNLKQSVITLYQDYTTESSHPIK